MDDVDFEDDQSESSEDSNKDDLPNENASNSDEENDEDDPDDVDDENDSDREDGSISVHRKTTSDGLESGDADERQTSISDPKGFTLQLMKKMRSLVSTVHHSSILDTHVRKQIQSKNNDSAQQHTNGDDQTTSNGELVIDFRIRWNSSHLMIHRFINIRHIVNEITHTLDRVIGLRPDQEKKLSRLAYNPSEWTWLMALEHVLQPFENATRILSGRNYQTLAIKQLVMTGLKTFLTTYKTGEVVVNTLKKLLLTKYQEHCENSISKEERAAMMVSKWPWWWTSIEIITDHMYSLIASAWIDECVLII